MAGETSLAADLAPHPHPYRLKSQPIEQVGSSIAQQAAPQRFRQGAGPARVTVVLVDWPEGLAIDGPNRPAAQAVEQQGRAD
jgi:hypothetical protein